MKRICIGFAWLAAGLCSMFAPAAFAQPQPKPTPTDTPSPSPTPSGNPDFEISPASYTFSRLCVGSSQLKTFTITNTGDTGLDIDSVTVSSAPVFTATDATPSAIAPGEKASFDLRFAPLRGGVISSVVTVSAGGVVHTANATGSGRDAEISVTPLSLSFGAQRVGAITPARSVVVASTGTDSVTVSSLFLTGSGDFTKNAAGPVLLQPGAQQRVQITFEAGSLGRKFGTLHVASDACTAAARTVSLTGVGGEAGITVQPATLSVAGYPGVSAAPGSVTIASSGLTALVVRSVSLAGPEADQFVLSGVPQLPVTLQPGDAIAVDIGFRPTSQKSPTPGATLVVGSSDPKHSAIKVVITSQFASPSPSPTPSATPTPAASPSASASPNAAAAGGIDFGKYAGEGLVLVVVGGIFATLLFLRNSKMRRIARRAGA